MEPNPPTPAPDSDTTSPQAAITATITSVITDLSDIIAEFPLPAGNAESVARQLDRLSEELAEAAGMVRRARRP